MIGYVDVGGCLRGIYGAAVLDQCLEKHISFDLMIGVSAGSANVVSYLAGQKHRNYRFYMDYSFRREYMGLRHFLKTGNYLDLEYIYGDALSNSTGEYPLFYEGVLKSGKHMLVVATDAQTGEPVYYTEQDMSQDDYGAIKGSSNVPVADHPYEWKGRLLFDGGLSDPIPFRKAFDAGCEKVVVLLTRPKDYFRTPEKDRRMALLIRRRYPKTADRLVNRWQLYNSQLEEALRLEAEGKVLIVAPSDIGQMSTLTKDKEQMQKLYEKGLEDANAITAFIG
ncbi:MAG: patatin family protein [Erysipelotrichaceae bacterium]|nr:patatin family protein [Erysipelotrichaceae bacterium]